MGRYEQLNEQPIAAESDVEFVCFTDDHELRSDTWTIRVVEPRFPLDSIRSARYFKVMGPTLLDGYDESLWIDNTVRLRRTPEELLDSWLANADLAFPLHSFRTSVLGEFDAVATDGYDDPSRVYEQLIHYSAEREEILHERPYWTALLARRRTAEVDETMRLWFDHLLRYSRRDQISINYILAATQIAVEQIDIDNENSAWHEWPVRVDRRWDRAQDRMAKALRTPSVEIGRLENENDRLRTELRMLSESADARIAERDALIQKEFTNSASWKLTAPIRAVTGRLRRR
jgi:hypothetical protein